MRIVNLCHLISIFLERYIFSDTKLSSLYIIPTSLYIIIHRSMLKAKAESADRSYSYFICTAVLIVKIQELFNDMQTKTNREPESASLEMWFTDFHDDFASSGAHDFPIVSICENVNLEITDLKN